MKKIYKYEFKLFYPLIELSLPIGAKVLCVQTDGKTDCPCIWALVDEDAPLEKRVFIVYPTGSSINISDKEYIGTFQMEGGYFVGHVFEKLN